MKLIKIAIATLGVCYFVFWSYDGYVRNEAEKLGVSYTSLVILEYGLLTLLSTLKVLLTFEVIDVVSKMNIGRAKMIFHSLFAGIVPFCMYVFIEKYDGDAVLYNGWHGLFLYPHFLSNIFLLCYLAFLRARYPQIKDVNGELADSLR